MKRNKMKRIGKIFRLACVLFALLVFVDFFRFPECYLTTWRYQLKNDLEQNEPEAIEYYNRIYVANGRELFE